MLPRRPAAAALRQLLGSLAAGSAHGSPAATAAAAAAAAAQPAGSSGRRAFAADAAAVDAGGDDVRQAAHQLGLDAVPLQELQRMMAPGAGAPAKDAQTVVSRGAAGTSKLKWGDLPGYHALLDALLTSGSSYALPSAPAYDAAQWADTHLKEVGLGLEPRGDFYVWRAWAAAHLPPEQMQTMLALEAVMGDETTRAALIKQSQHELARLWDWQHRRAALGLSPDLSPAAAAAAAEAAGEQQAAAAAAEARAAAAALDALEQQQDAASESSASESDLSEADESFAALSAAAAQQSDDDGDAAQQQLSLADVLALAEAQESAGQQPGAGAGGSTSSSAAAAAAVEPPGVAVGGGGGALAAAAAALGVSLVDDVADRAAPQQHPLLRKWAQSQQAHEVAARQVQQKLARGRSTAERGKHRYMDGVAVRQYQPVFDDGDIFLPGKPFGSRQVAAALADPATAPVSPAKVAAQATAVAAAAAAAVQAGLAPPGADGAPAALADVACWSSMPLLDRTVLREESMRRAAEKLAARPKAAQPWRLLDDGYVFDLQARPPTRALDLLTGYLEVRYADVLLRRDAVASTQRALALHALRQRGGGGGEAAESPPAALTAGASLSAQERASVTATLDGLLDGKQFGRYREAVLQLYCDGLITWGELQECWAAAQAGEELAAAEGPVGGVVDDRQQLFSILSGAQQLQDLVAAGSGARAPAADEAAARQAWAAAGEKLQSAWAAAAGGDGWWAGEPVVYDEAAALWQQLLTLAGQPDGPGFAQVLLARSDDAALQQQLRRLHEALERATGLTPACVEALQGAGGGSSPAELEQRLQPLLSAPPTLDQLLQQHWDRVAQEELGQQPSSSSGGGGAPSWGQLWPLLQQLTRHLQQQAAAAAGGGAAEGAPPDAADLFERFVREADGVPLTPPPYPGARRLLRWEQRIVLHVGSGDTVLPAELKVKLAVSAAELAEEAGLSEQGLDYLLAIAGRRYDAETGVLTLACDRFPTREENRRWCLEVLHRLLGAAHARFPAPGGLRVDSASVLGPEQPPRVAALLAGGGGSGG